MTIETLVNMLKDKDAIITVISWRKSEQIYHGPARGAIELGYGNYSIRHVDGLTWYW